MIAGIYGPDIRAPWRELTVENALATEAAIGVFEIRDPDGHIALGYASATSPRGLRGELIELAAAPDAVGRFFRAEVITTYLTRFFELAGRQIAHGAAKPSIIGRDAEAGIYHIASIKPVGPRTTAEDDQDHD